MINPIITVDDKFQKDDIKRLIELGIKSFRINPARIGCQKAYRVYLDICSLQDSSSIFIDTAGNKSRIFISEKNKLLGQNVIISSISDVVADFYIDSELFRRIGKGDCLVIRGEELVEVIIKEVQADVVLGECEVPGLRIRNHSHIYIADKYFENIYLNEKDMEILDIFSENEANNLALSFADSDELILLARKQSQGNKIFAKIETPRAYEKIDSIIEASDGIIIGRDDLSVFYDEEEINALTLAIAKKCKKNKKVCIPASNFFVDLFSAENLVEEKREYLRLLINEGVTDIYCNETVMNRNIEFAERVLNNCNISAF